MWIIILKITKEKDKFRIVYLFGGCALVCVCFGREDMYCQTVNWYFDNWQFENDAVYLILFLLCARDPDIMALDVKKMGSHQVRRHFGRQKIEEFRLENIGLWALCGGSESVEIITIVVNQIYRKYAVVSIRFYGLKMVIALTRT